jgi:hypothetical protein
MRILVALLGMGWVGVGWASPPAKGASRLTVISQPWSSVFINNRLIALQTPLVEKALPAGRHIVKVCFEGDYDDCRKRRLTIRGESKKLVFRRDSRSTGPKAVPPVSPKTKRDRTDPIGESAHLSVLARPGGAVFVDGRLIAKQTPLIAQALPLGRHVVKVCFEGKPDDCRSKRITLKGGQIHMKFAR